MLTMRASEAQDLLLKCNKLKLYMDKNYKAVKTVIYGV